MYSADTTGTRPSAMPSAALHILLRGSNSHSAARIQKPLSQLTSTTISDVPLPESTMSPLSLRSLLLLIPAVLTFGVDIAPPEAPNPYGTSEGRAIRDVMEETYHQKLSDKVPLDALQAAYRKAWNDDQLKRYDHGQDPDPKWLAAYKQEEETKSRSRLVNDLSKLGGQADDAMDTAALERAIVDRKAAIAKEKSALAEAEIAKRREEAIRQIEGEQHRQPAPERSSVTDKRAMAMTAYFAASDAMSDADIMKTYIAAHFETTHTALEKKELEARAKKLVDERQAFKKRGGVPAMVSGTGVEIWALPIPTNDPEKIYFGLKVFNFTDKAVNVKNYQLDVKNSTRNPATISVTEDFIGSFAASWSSSLVGSSGPYFKDPGQTIKMTEATLTPP